MVANVSPIFELTPVNSGIQFTSADTTTKKTLCTAAANGSRIDGIVCCTNDTTAVNLAFYINDGSADHYIGVVNVPIGSGYTTVVRVDAITTIAPAALGCLVLKAGYVLKVACMATMTAAKTTDVVALGGDY